MPCSRNPFPLTVALEIVTLTVPVFISCMVCEFVVPISTLPKLTLAGLNTSFPGVWPAAGKAVNPPSSNATSASNSGLLHPRGLFGFCWEFGLCL